MDTHRSTLTINVSKRIPPRAWLGPLGRPQWQSLTLSLSPNATLTFTRSHHSHDSDNASDHPRPRFRSSTFRPLLAACVVPGGARRATHAEQVAHLRDHLVIIVTEPKTNTPPFDTRPRRALHVCAASNERDANAVVAFANAASFRLVGATTSAALSASALLPSDASLLEQHRPDQPSQRQQQSHVPYDACAMPYAAPFLSVWGTHAHLSPEAAAAAANQLGAVISRKAFAALVQTTSQQPKRLQYGINPAVSSSVFVLASMSFVVDAFSPCIPLLASMKKAVSAGLDSSSVTKIADVLQTSPESVRDTLRHAGVENVDAATMFYLLFHPDNSVVDKRKAADPHDMTRPLGDYLISSSHNTYLTGDQLQSASSEIMYRIALEKGCRCVEIDAWNGDDGIPVVTHGHTMTSDVPLENVLKVISENAFAHGNDAPVIVSLENHLDLERQKIAADLFDKVFGDRLCRVSQFDMSSSLPSPNELRGRILLKTKTMRSIVQDNGAVGMSGGGGRESGEDGPPSGNDSFDSEDTEDDMSGEYGKVSKKGSGGSGSGSGSGSHDGSASGRNSRRGSGNLKEKPAKTKIAPELDALVMIANGNRKSLLSYWKRGESGVHTFVQSSCISLDEKRMQEMYERHHHGIIREYNSHALTRVYPKGSRIGSSNYTPTMAHSLGCQIVALNWQRHDAALAVNEARFMANRGCGYLLSSSVRPTGVGRKLHIRVVGAFLLPFVVNGDGTGRASGSAKLIEVDDPYVTIKLYDDTFNDEDDYSCFKFETSYAKKSALAPVWNETATMTVRNVNLAVINVKVYDRDRTSGDDLIGYCAVPTAFVREGLRSFMLKSKNGDDLTLAGTHLGPSVLCDVRWE